MPKFIDNLLNRITMYKLVMYYLIGLFVLAVLFGWLGWLSYSPLSLLLELAVILALCLSANTVFSRTFGAPANTESVYITTLILALIIAPPPLGSFTDTLPLMVWASVWAMASKYIFAIGKKHVFNPAAFGVAVTALTMNASATWWVGGNLPLLPFVLVGGLLVVRKIRRGDLVIPFFATAFLTIIGFSLPQSPASSLQSALLHSPILFFAFVMLTEPLTTPPTRRLRIIYGTLAGFLFAPMIHVFSVYSTPELALLAANLFSYAVSPKGRLILRLKDIVQAGDDSYDFVFESDKVVRFRPGQYLEWTLPHGKTDSRGNRRYFTIASAPTEYEVRIGVKFYKKPSSFKQALLSMRPGDKIFASQLSGDFVLPKNPDKKLAFIAGGIGITPFRSMVQYLMDREEKREMVLLYSNRTEREVSYRDIFDQAASVGLATRYVITGETPNSKNTVPGRIDQTLIQREIPDYEERIFYISGPQGMVQTFKDVLKRMGVPGRHIKTDYFPGLA